MALEKEEYESISLSEWVSLHPVEDEIRSTFLNMDRALKYIHEHGYCIEVFYPSEIQILNNDDDFVQFNKLMKLPDDPSLSKKYIQEDIFRSSFIQIGIYSKSLQYLQPDFLRENFDSFTQFLPNGDVPYYRGVVERNASVYFCEFALEKRDRDLRELERELGEDVDNEKAIQKQKVNLTNDSVNDVIYRQINGIKDRAFVNWLLIPTIVFGMLLLFGVISWVISIFSV